MVGLLANAMASPSAVVDAVRDVAVSAGYWGVPRQQCTAPGTSALKLLHLRTRVSRSWGSVFRKASPTCSAAGHPRMAEVIGGVC